MQWYDEIDKLEEDFFNDHFEEEKQFKKQLEWEGTKNELDEEGFEMQVDWSKE